MHGRNIKSIQDSNQWPHAQKSQYHNHWANENSPKHSCQVLYLNREAAMPEGVVSHNKEVL